MRGDGVVKEPHVAGFTRRRCEFHPRTVSRPHSGHLSECPPQLCLRVHIACSRVQRGQSRRTRTDKGGPGHDESQGFTSHRDAAGRCTTTGVTAERHSLAAAFPGPGEWPRRVCRADRIGPRVDGAGVEIREFVLLWIRARDFEHQARHHPGRNSHDQELRSVERRVQPDAESQVRPVRLEESLAGLAASRPVCPGHGPSVGPGRQRRSVRGSPAAGHGRAPAGQGTSRRVRQAVPGPTRRTARACRNSKRSGSAGRTRKQRACWPAAGACRRSSPT